MLTVAASDDAGGSSLRRREKLAVTRWEAGVTPVLSTEDRQKFLGSCSQKLVFPPQKNLKLDTHWQGRSQSSEVFEKITEHSASTRSYCARAKLHALAYCTPDLLRSRSGNDLGRWTDESHHEEIVQAAQPHKRVATRTLILWNILRIVFVGRNWLGSQ
jgi:hypothetical protein